MLTQKSLDILLSEVATDLVRYNIPPHKIILFGSYANGNVHAYSDVDVALWSDRFSGRAMEDFDIIHPVAKKHRSLSFKLYPSHATSTNFDPFIEIIEQTGKLIYEQEKHTR